MSPVLIGLIGFLVLFILLAAGMSIGFSLGLVGFAGMCILYPLPAAMIKMSTVPLEVMSSYSLAVLPLFLLMANLIFVCGLGAELFKLAAKWLGHFRGGLAMAGIGGATGFAAISGSSLATAATMGLVALPEMKKYGYEPKFAAGSIAAGGTIGSLLPPSAMFIIYGIITENSIGKLFAASIIPALLTALSYILTIYILCRRNPKLGPRAEKATWKERFEALKTCWSMLALVVFVIGGMMIGLFTATEAGAVGAIGALVLALSTGKLTFAKFKEAFLSTMKTSGMIYGIVLGAFIFNYFCAKTTLPQVTAEWAAGLPVPSWVIMSAIIGIYFLLGTVMEAPSIQLLTLPVFYPLIVTTLGYNPIWFGVIQVRMLEISLITPPLGMCAYIVSGVSQDKLTVQDVFRGVTPFLLMELVTMPLFMFIQPITLWLPSLMK